MLASDAVDASVDLRPPDLAFKDLILHFAEVAPDTLGAAALLFHVDPETENSYCREDTRFHSTYRFKITPRRGITSPILFFCFLRKEQ